MKRRTFLGAAAGLAATGALSACGNSSNPLGGSSSSATGGGSAAPDTVVVGSAAFPESELLANIYAGALQAKNVKVSTKLDISTRETYVPALEKGEINLIPEYTGNLARYLDKSADISDSTKALAALKKALPSSLVALTPSPAQDTDSMVVTADTASKYNLKSIDDLKAHASSMVLAAPAEFKSRIDGVPGLQRVYGLSFQSFRGMESSSLIAQSLKNGQAQVANLFSTDPYVAANNFTVLTDPKKLFGAQNIVPVMTASKASDTVKTALAAVSAKLTTDAVSGLVKQVVIDKKDASAVAQQWLKDNNLA